MNTKGDRRIEGSFINDSFAAGHSLRDRAAFPNPTQRKKIPLVIVGGGIAGLSAAWNLQKLGFYDFVLLEMNEEAGGNARSGQNAVSAYPWAAHYVPVPGPKATYVRELFEDLGVLVNGRWDERHLCFAPQERMFMYGRWQDGIEPAVGLSRADREQFLKIQDLLTSFRREGGFTIPIEIGIEKSPRELDRVSFAAWLKQQGVEAPAVLWYMNYCCRDDYGALASDTSAWAGIHYFASREPDEKGPLTWPEGNGWITRQLLQRVGARVRCGVPVSRITRLKNRYSVVCGDTEYECDVVIFAAPTFLAAFIIEGFPRLASFEYSPWLTANLTLDRFPRGGSPDEIAWDNVVYASPTLGYVDATHQTVKTHIERTVWTFYWALADGAPATNRRRLLSADWNYWKQAILDDLERVHPDIRACVSRIDVMRMGHAMARPIVGSMFAEERRRLVKEKDGLFFANSDLSGISIFEEAQYRGITASLRAIAHLGRG
jgi:glycine/D-amino acid oxidase-like deaminating enzyme